MKMEDEFFEDINKDVMGLDAQTQTVKKILVEYIQLVQSAIKTSMPIQTYFRSSQEKIKDITQAILKVQPPSLTH